jgi:hypothetical protein
MRMLTSSHSELDADKHWMLFMVLARVLERSTFRAVVRLSVSGIFFISLFGCVDANASWRSTEACLQQPTRAYCCPLLGYLWWVTQCICYRAPCVSGLISKSDFVWCLLYSGHYSAKLAVVILLYYISSLSTIFGDAWRGHQCCCAMIACSSSPMTSTLFHSFWTISFCISCR